MIFFFFFLHDEKGHDCFRDYNKSSDFWTESLINVTDF